ncbi:MAG: sigma 54-interacting transcriptional regulator [Dehalobacterium sp.]
MNLFLQSEGRSVLLMISTNKSTEEYGDQIIFEEWKKFFEGKEIGPKIVSPLVSASWQRSKEAGVDPNHLRLSYLLEEEKKKQKILIKKYGNELIVIRKTAIKMGLNFQLFDNCAQSVKMFNFTDYLAPEEIKFNKVEDLSENLIGTNAVCLALKENKPVQLRGYDNYCSYFHDYFCSAAPIHDVNGNIIGVINTFSYQAPQRIETLGLIELLASLFDNLLLISNASKEKTYYDVTMQEIIESLPYGLVFIDEDNLVKHYNDRILHYFHIKKSSNVNLELFNYLATMNCFEDNNELEKSEVLLDIEGSKRSFLFSTKNMLDLNKKQKGKIIIIEDTQSLLKSANKLRGNRAIYTFHDIVGSNQKILYAKSVAERVAKAPSSILIMGESGTGKELFAQAIHNASFRKDKPFVAVNCGAIPTDLIESELFGYEAGAFTGALKGGKPGQIELANGGTLFLDEIESMSLNMQIKLLRALSAGSIMKIGGREEILVDVRIISATKKDLLVEADNGTFRDDLYYRINTFIIQIPPLRERKDDIPILTDFFIDKFTRQFNLSKIKVTEEYLNALSNYHWRGNIRELKNEIERSVVLLGQEQTLTTDYLHERITNACREEKIRQSLNAFSPSEVYNHHEGLLKIAEDILIEKVLLEENGNITKAAKKLGITTPTLYQKINSNEKLLKVKKSIK